jgi:hypothetical protein
MAIEMHCSVTTGATILVSTILGYYDSSTQTPPPSSNYTLSQTTGILTSARTHANSRLALDILQPKLRYFSTYILTEESCTEVAGCLVTSAHVRMPWNTVLLYAFCTCLSLPLVTSACRRVRRQAP